MMAGHIRPEVIADRIQWVEKMLAQLEALPLSSPEEFFADPHHAGAAESYLRRAIEALCDLGRHILAKGFARAVTEYKQIADELGARQVLTTDEAALLRTLAGYRNRLVHFYHEVTDEELYDVCAHQRGDLRRIIEAYHRWLQAHPEKIDETL